MTRNTKLSTALKNLNTKLKYHDTCIDLCMRYHYITRYIEQCTHHRVMQTLHKYQSLHSVVYTPAVVATL